LTQDIGFVWGPSHPGLGGVRDRGGEGEFSMIGRCSSGVFEAHPGTPVPSAPDSPSLLTTEGKCPRGSPAFRGIKVIVVSGELRERIAEVSGRRGMGLGSRF